LGAMHLIPVTPGAGASRPRALLQGFRSAAHYCGQACLKMGYKAGAQRDVARCLHLSPDAKDTAELREQLVELNAVRTSRMH
jgi:hypothetical protein